ncbi:ABC transporter substrate-binding protein [Micromonospora sp. NPDC048830]|uniref:ABC transporter substrate-binding protein n=1 Tax=Micromonospora sp. NPDC048830 TaxID=3364257 RepID=UPI003710A224
MTSRTRPVRLVGVAVTATVSLLLAACGGGSGGGPAASTKLNKGDTFVIADETQPLSGIDPVMAQAHDAKRMVAQFYEGLLQLAPDGKTVEPALAEQWKRTSPTEYEFTLRKGVKFHDGSELTPEDVAFSLKRVVDPKQNSPYRSLYRIADVEVAGDSRVVVKLTAPQTSLPRLLAQPWSGGIVNKKWITSKSADELKTQENGTGPYKLDEFKEGSTITTSAFPDYWDGVPEIAKVTYRVMPDESTRVQALQSGAIQMTQVRLPRNVQQLEKAGFNIGDTYRVGAYWLAMNVKEGPLSDERVRRAVNLGVDRKQLVDIGSQGAGVPSGVVPPGDPFGTDVGADMPNYQYDPDRAKQLLADAGAKNVTLTLAIRAESPEKLATAQLVKEQLAKIGVTVQIRQVEWSRLVNAITSGKWEADLVQLTAALNADPSQYLDLWFAKGGAATKVDDPKLWQMMAAAVEDAETEEQRAAAYREIDRYIAEKAYILIPYASVQVWEASAPGVKFNTEPSNTRLFLKDATLR